MYGGDDGRQTRETRDVRCDAHHLRRSGRARHRNTFGGARRSRRRWRSRRRARRLQACSGSVRGLRRDASGGRPSGALLVADRTGGDGHQGHVALVSLEPLLRPAFLSHGGPRHVARDRLHDLACRRAQRVEQRHRQQRHAVDLRQGHGHAQPARVARHPLPGRRARSSRARSCATVSSSRRAPMPSSRSTQ
jgi:hypothetical protein